MKCPDLVTLPPEPTRVPYKERESAGPAETETKKETPAEQPRETDGVTGGKAPPSGEQPREADGAAEAKAPSGGKGEMVCVGDVCFIKPAEKDDEPKLPECFKPPAQVMTMEAPPPQGQAAADDDGNKTAPSEPSPSAEKPADSAVPNDISNASVADPVVQPTPAS